MTESISESRFHMWRCVVGMAHADGIITPHELAFINDYVKDLSFSKEQLDIMGEDLLNPQDVDTLFSSITDPQDKKDFFALARALSWCDGDYDAQEKLIIERLEKSSAFEENQKVLRESREVLNEVELCQDQWKSKTEHSKSLFGFLNGLRSPKEATA